MRVEFAIAMLMLAVSGTANAGPYCGDLKNAYGPFDYSNRAFASNLEVVETHHFTEDVEKLRDKATRFPNTHWSVECYFDRAVRFKPTDAGVRTIYGGYLFKLGRTDEALAQLQEAVRLQPDNGTANHNLGIIHFQKKDYEKAAVFTKKADALGFPLPGVKNKLIAMGKWDSSQ